MPNFALRAPFMSIDEKMFIRIKNSGVESKIGIRHTVYGIQCTSLSTIYSMNFAARKSPGIGEK